MTATTGEQLLSDYLARLDAAALRLPPDRRAELREGIAEHVAAARAAGELRDETGVRTLLDRLGEPEEIVAAAAEDVPPAAGGPPWADRPSGAPPQLVPRPPGTGLEVAAVLMLTAGSLVPVVGWLVGVALLWSSRRWRRSEKLLATLVVPGGPGILLPLSVLSPFARTCSTEISVSPAPAIGGLPTLEAPMPGGPPAAPPEPPAAPPEVVLPPPGATELMCEGGTQLPGWLVVAMIVVALIAPFVVAAVLLRRARARAAAEPPVLQLAGGATWGGLEVAAVLVLALGSFLVPFVGSLVGLVLVWMSPRWTQLEKAVATVVTLLPIAVVALGFAGGPFLLPFGLFAAALLAVLGPLFAAGYLALVLHRR